MTWAAGGNGAALAVRAHGACLAGGSAPEDRFVVAELTRALVSRHDNLGPREGPPQSPPDAHVLAVVTGGGAAPAARRAARGVMDALLAAAVAPGATPRLAPALARCAAHLASGAAGGLCASVTAAFVVFPRALILHAGRSGAYHQRGDALRPLTGDTPPLGAGARPAVVEQTLEPGDALLVCSHPVRWSLPTRRLEWLMRSTEDPWSVCRDLIAAASSASGGAAATALVARFCAARPTAPASAAAAPDRAASPARP